MNVHSPLYRVDFGPRPAACWLRWTVAICIAVWTQTASAETERLGDVVCYVEEASGSVAEPYDYPLANEFGRAAISALASSHTYGALVRMELGGLDGVVRVFVVDVPLSGGLDSFVFDAEWDSEWLYYEGTGGPADFFGNELSGVLVTQSSLWGDEVVLDGAGFDVVVTDYGLDGKKGGSDDRYRTLTEGTVFVDAPSSIGVVPDTNGGFGVETVLWIEPDEVSDDWYDPEPAYGCGGSDDDYQDYGDDDEQGCGGDGYDDSESSQGCESDSEYDDSSSEGCGGDDGDDEGDDDGCVKDAEASSAQTPKSRKPRWQRRAETVVPFVLLVVAIHLLRRRAS